MVALASALLPLGRKLVAAERRNGEGGRGAAIAVRADGLIDMEADRAVLHRARQDRICRVQFVQDGGGDIAAVLRGHQRREIRAGKAGIAREVAQLFFAQLEPERADASACDGRFSAPDTDRFAGEADPPAGAEPPAGRLGVPGDAPVGAETRAGVLGVLWAAGVDKARGYGAGRAFAAARCCADRMACCW